MVHTRSLLAVSSSQTLSVSVLQWLTLTQSSRGRGGNTHTHSRLTALCPGLPGWAGTGKVKPIWILLKQETVSGTGISWAICKSAHRSRRTTTPAPHHSVFTGQMTFLSPNQQRQNTEGRGGKWFCYQSVAANTTAAAATDSPSRSAYPCCVSM